MLKNRVKTPSKIETELLYQSARTCCVCRTPKLPVQVHHIDQNPSNNDIENLIVLCTNCHDEAHTKHDLSQNLNANRLKAFRTKWHNEVLEKSSRAMLPSGNLSQAMWTFVNHQRLPHVMRSADIEFDQYLKELLTEDNIIDQLGIPIFPKKEINKIHKTIYDYFSWDNSQRLHFLYTKAIDDIILNLNPIEIGAIWSKKEIIDLVSPGNLIFCMKGMYFKSANIVDGEEDRYVYSCSKGVEVRFYANTRHMYGNSALYNSFSGHKFVATLLLVKNIGSENGKLVIDCTPLALGYGFVSSEYKTPHPLKYGWHTFQMRTRLIKN